MITPIPVNEAARLQALGRSEPAIRPSKALDDLTAMVVGACSVPAGFISIVEADKVRYVSRVGTAIVESSRHQAFCSWTIMGTRPVIIGDTLADSRFRDNPLVQRRKGIRFYAAAPIMSADGYALGALCVIDRKARALTEHQVKSLTTLASQVASVIEMNRQSLDLERMAIQRDDALRALAASEERYTLVVQSSSDGLWDWNLETNEVEFCPRWKSMMGYQDQDLGRAPDEWFRRVHPEDIEQLQTDIISHLLGITGQLQNEHRLRGRGGEFRWMLARGQAIWDEERGVYRMAGTLTDVTEQKQVEHNAYHDALTGLPNRAVFMERLKRSLERSKYRERHLFAVMFIDLDRFKIINDSLGHHVGDQVLLAMARQLRLSVRPGDMIARMGGDEFAIILDRLDNVSDATQAAQRIQNLLSSPLNLNGREVFVTASIGIAIGGAEHDKPEAVLRDADAAMYRAKHHGRGRYEVYDEHMSANAAATSQLEKDLRLGLARDEFIVHYQPIISLSNWRINGFEALVRWQHPARGFLSPMKFIPLAEETGLIIPLGQWILKEACRQLRYWQDQFPSEHPLTISVNLSGKQLSQPDLISRIDDILVETGIPPATLKMEITESAIIENVDSAAEILKQLKSLGLKISLDDFGTGYSSLSYLHKFPIDTLKIDRSFVTRMNLPKDIEILRTIVALASALGMDVIAEGVETREQVMQLAGLNCESVQGYLLSHPLDATAMTMLIRETYPIAGRDDPEYGQAGTGPLGFVRGLIQ